MKINLVLSFLLLYSSALMAQTEYKVGTSVVSIEPDNSVFSVPLAGYGYPREGRFSIEWIKKRSAIGIKSLTGLNQSLIAVTHSGALLKRNIADEGAKWEKLKSDKELKLLAGLNGQLYAVSSGNQLLAGKIDRTSVKWRVVSEAPDATGLAASGEHLYIITSSGQLQEGTFKDNSVSWQEIGKADNCIALAGGSGRLYMVSSDQLLWQRKDTRQGTEWIKIGYPNGSSYTQTMKQIAVAGGRLFAVGDNNTLYQAEHNTLDELSSRALAVTYRDKTVVIVGVDLTGFDYSLACNVKKEIERKYGIPAEAILINASHSHFAPVAQWFPTWGAHQQVPDSVYFNNKIRKGIVESIEKALANRVPAFLSFGRGETHIGANRVLVGDDALYDPSLDVFRAETKGNDKDALLFLTGCHPVFRNEGTEGYTISPNFPGFARKIIEEKTGVQQAMFIQGCAGDINPVTDNPVETGSRLAEDVLKTLGTSFTPLGGEISYSLDSVLLPANVWSKEQITQFKAENSNREGDVEAEKNVRWADMMLGCYARNAVPKYLPVYVHTINIGNWKLVGLSREAVTEYGLAIRKLWPDRLVSVSGYTNAVPSYLPTAIHIRNHTYEGYGSFFWNAQPALFPENTFDVILDAIRKNDK